MQQLHLLLANGSLGLLDDKTDLSCLKNNDVILVRLANQGDSSVQTNRSECDKGSGEESMPSFSVLERRTSGHLSRQIREALSVTYVIANELLRRWSSVEAAVEFYYNNPKLFR